MAPGACGHAFKNIERQMPKAQGQGAIHSPTRPRSAPAPAKKTGQNHAESDTVQNDSERQTHRGHKHIVDIKEKKTRRGIECERYGYGFYGTNLPWQTSSR